MRKWLILPILAPLLSLWGQSASAQRILEAPSVAWGAEAGSLSAKEAPPERRHPAPDFALKTLEGTTVRLSALRGKKVVLLNFWATWCPPCRQEMPTLQQIYTDYKRKGLEILAITSEPAAEDAIRGFVTELRLTFPVLLDPQGEVSRMYRVPGLPASVLIDRQGIIRHIGIGYRTWTDREPRREIESVLKERLLGRITQESPLRACEAVRRRPRVGTSLSAPRSSMSQQHAWPLLYGVALLTRSLRCGVVIPAV